jgi:hypothetical protein
VTPVTFGEAFVMSDAATGLGLCQTEENWSGALLRTILIGLTAFLTVVDLFATQAILPTLTHAYNVTPAAMGVRRRVDTAFVQSMCS